MTQGQSECILGDFSKCKLGKQFFFIFGNKLKGCKPGEAQVHASCHMENLASKDNVQGEAEKERREIFLEEILPALEFLDPSFPECGHTILFPQVESMN